MVFDILSLEDERLAPLISNSLKGLFGNSEVPFYFTVVKNKNDEVLSYCAFSQSVQDPRGMNLEYVYVLPEARGHDLGARLMDASVEYFFKNGYSSVDCHMVGETKQLYEYYYFLLKWKFILLSEDGHRMHFKYDDMKDTQTLQLVSAGREKLPIPAKITDRDDFSVRKFVKKEANNGFWVSSDLLFSEFTRYHFAGEGIDAILPAAITDDGTLNIFYFYCTDKKNLNTIFLAMLTDCIEEARKEIGPELKVIIDINSERLYKGMQEAFNPPEEEYLVMDLTRMTV